MIDATERVMAITPPETDLRRGQVRVLCGDRVDVRTVTVAEGRDAWLMWAKEIAFALQNLQFVDIGDTVYRCATIDRIEPVDAEHPDETVLALNATIAALVAIRDGEKVDPREMAAELLRILESRGFLPT